MAQNKSNKRLKGIYLVPDPLMMKPHFGPSEHIKVGLEELQKQFDIELLLGGKLPMSVFEKKGNNIVSKNKSTKNGFIGLLRDIKLLIKSNISIFSLYKELKAQKLDFIYERGQYLDFRGVVIARLLGIRHFYEVNWLNFLGIQQFYSSWFNRTAKYLEEKSYALSTKNFFVGTQDRLIKINPSKVCTIQNGISESLVEINAKHQNNLSSSIKICYVANLMPHHRFEIFLESLQYLTSIDKIELHLIGYNFESYSSHFPENLKVKFHGPVKKELLPDLLSTFNVGLISGGPSYSSFMKLFEYAAFKLCVICPDLENIKLMFPEKEIIYFKDESANSLGEQINLICQNPDLIPAYGNNIYKKVKEDFTWEAIYYRISAEMKNLLN